jgi:Ala-tRNA(Pro) deacylase
MALNERLKRFLEDRHVVCDTMPHHEAFTAQEVAAEAHVAGRRLAKPLVVKENGHGYLMAVLPAACRLDLPALRELAGRRHLSLAAEAEFVRLFPDCDLGAMPPFGNLYDMPVYLDACFPEGGDIYFQAGNHHEVARMPYESYQRLVNPVIGELCLHEREKRMGE